MHLVFAQSGEKLRTVNKALLPMYLRLKVEKYEAKARLAAQKQRGKVIPHKTQEEIYDMTYRQQKGKRVPASEKAAWDFLQ